MCILSCIETPFPDIYIYPSKNADCPRPAAGAHQRGLHASCWWHIVQRIIRAAIVCLYQVSVYVSPDDDDDCLSAAGWIKSIPVSCDVHSHSCARTEWLFMNQPIRRHTTTQTRLICGLLDIHVCVRIYICRWNFSIIRSPASWRWICRPVLNRWTCCASYANCAISARMVRCAPLSEYTG